MELDELYNIELARQAQSIAPNIEGDAEFNAEELEDSASSETEDLYNAIEQLQATQTFLEDILKDDIQRKFLRVSQRAELMAHCADTMTFLDQFNDEEFGVE